MYFFNIRFRAKEPVSKTDIIFHESSIKKDVPKKVWMYWEGNEIPYIVELCIDKIIKNNPDFEINFINQTTLFKFINVEDIPNFNLIQHKADYIRLKLLYQYGGVWIDSSIMMFENLNYYLKILSKHNCSFLSFYWDINSTDDKYPIVQNWFMISSKNNQFIKDWLDEFVYATNLGVDQYVKKIKKNNPEYLQRIKDPIYFYNFICSQKPLRKYNDFVLLNCSNDAILYHLTGSWRNILFRKKFIHYTNFIKNISLYKRPKKLPPLIKITSGERFFVEKILKSKKYKDNSLLDIFIGD